MLQQEPGGRGVLQWGVRVAAVVLAAGEGRRFGGPKALARLGGRTFLEAATALFVREEIEALIAVVGADAERVAREVSLPPGTTLAVNPGYTRGMLTSVWAGLDAAEALGVDAVLLHPVDNPLARPDTVAAVLGALAAGAVIAIPSHGGRRGHPAGFARAAWRALRDAPLEGGARAVLSARPEWLVHVPAGPDCLVDVDTPAELAAALRALDLGEP